jgi:hypothetical protein
LGVCLFLDLLHFATTNVDAGDPARLSVFCPACGGSFRPLMPAAV